jgi:hypothetical protein
MGRVKLRFVCSVLGRLLLATKEDSSLQDRVEAIVTGSYSLQDKEFPNSALESWHLILKARRKPLSDHMKAQYQMRSINKFKAVAGSLTRRELKEVINAYLFIVSSAVK